MAATGSSRSAFRAQRAKIEQRQTALTPSQVLIGQSTPNATTALMRRVRGGTWTAGTPTAAAQGNSVIRSDPRGEPAAQPGKGAGDGIADQSPYGGRVIYDSPSRLLRRARTPGYQWGRLIARDRHIAQYRGTTKSSGNQQQTGGTPNPEADGPPVPANKMLNRTLSWQIGTDCTRNLDNTVAKPQTSAGANPFPLGTQGDPYTRIYGGTPGLAQFRPYGSRTGIGPGAPDPKTRALPGGPYRAGTILSPGAPTDGPQKFPSGPPWGLHSATVEPLKWTGTTQKIRFSQVKPPKMNRPLNAKTAGQSYDQQVVHLDGSQAVKVPSAKTGRQPGTNARWRRS